MDNYTSVMLAREECRDNEAALACCDLFLNTAEIIDTPHFLELSQPQEDNDLYVELIKDSAIQELKDSIARMTAWIVDHETTSN